MGNQQSSATAVSNPAEVRLIPKLVPFEKSKKSVQVFVYPESSDSVIDQELVGLTMRLDEEGGAVAYKLWPGGKMLADFFVGEKFAFPTQARVLEIGCGIALPSLAIARHGLASHVTVSDRSSVQPLVKEEIKVNSLAGVCSFRKFDWGSVEDLNFFSSQKFDIVIGSDIVYVEEQQPLINALLSVVRDETWLVISYTPRSEMDETYWDSVILRNFILHHQEGTIFVFKRRPKILP